MKKPTIISLLYFVLTSLTSFSQGEWIEEVIDPDTGLRTGKIEINGVIATIDSGVDLSGINLEGADLQGANLEKAILISSNFKGANLEGANLSQSRLNSANFSDANLSESNFSLSILQGTNFSSANLNSADISATNMSNAIFKDSNLENANLYGVNISGTNFSGSKINGASVYPFYNSSNESQQAIQNFDLKVQLEQLKAMNLISNKIETLNTRISELAVKVQEKDEKIATLEKRPTLEEVQEGRAGSVILTVEPDGDNITLGLTIEQSDNLVEWTKLNGEMTRTIPIPDGKKFYRFALDK
ncbi:pentapeptide repeat-containing protein [Verrucomicrobiales bacterium]|nr:pentapeptide repeat-containing protein [Verrucomicrobiales bacterium]